MLERQRRLDDLKVAQRQAEAGVAALEDRRTDLEQAQQKDDKRLADLTKAGRTGYEKALRRQELRTFLLRLALILPLLLLAVWLFLKHRKGPRWPFVWGFVFFALFAFFVELVPYLPSYGGYLRYLVGIALTIWGGNYAIVALRRYLDTQKAAEQRPEQERRNDLSYELAQVRLARRICPACERPIDVADPAANFCMHCGLLIFAECARCHTRQTSFSHFCRSCGLLKRGAPPEGSLPPPAAVVSA